MAAIGWKFRYLPEDQKHTEPTHSQEFDRNGPARSLVREAIQNSLDAREDHSKPVRVRIKFGTTSDAGAHSFLDGLWPHLNVENVRNLLKCSKKQAAFRYLAFEDFNTRGLTGDVNGKSASHGATKNHFFCFWHKVGQSSNDHKTLGNRGVGKVAFQVASGINTFFGLTRRVDDPANAYLMGEAGLVTHDDQPRQDVRLVRLPRFARLAAVTSAAYRRTGAHQEILRGIRVGGRSRNARAVGRRSLR